MFEQEATRRVLVRKGLLANEEVLEEIKVVRREMEGRRAEVDLRLLADKKQGVSQER